MLLDFSIQDEVDGDRGSEHPDSGISERGETKGTCATHALFVILDVKAERRADEDSGDIEAADHTMKFCKTLSQSIGELHRPEQESARAHDAVRQKIPLESADVSPLAVGAVYEKALIVEQNVGHH